MGKGSSQQQDHSDPSQSERIISRLIQWKPSKWEHFRDLPREEIDKKRGVLIRDRGVLIRERGVLIRDRGVMSPD